mmetsp:Transcript_58114/g.169911  ORF Transcript_58114/g.169911 Transcript_58114/m.169911 type:complete len:249 (+) Transcript_58114:1768-2514(+)
MQADNVVHKDVATPRGGGGRVGQAGEHPEGPGAGRPDGAAPEPEHGGEGAHGHRLVVEAAAHGAHDVRGDDGHDEGRGHARAGALRDLHRKEEQQEGRQTSKPSWYQTANIIQAHGFEDKWLAAVWQLGDHCLGDESKQFHRIRKLTLWDHLQNTPDYNRSNLHTRIDGCADRPSDRIPAHIVVPSEELVPALLCQIHSCTVVEPWVKFMDDVAILFDRMQTYSVCSKTEVKDSDKFDNDQCENEEKA